MTREEIIDKLAQEDTDDTDLSDLMSFFYSNQYDYYATLSDKELEEEVDKHAEYK